MIISYEGMQGSIKSTVALSGPLPIVHFAFDMGYNRAINGMAYDALFKGLDVKVWPYDPKLQANDKSLWAGHDITIFEMPAPPQTDPVRVEGCAHQWGIFHALTMTAMLDKEVRHIAIDTGTLMRKLRVDVHLEELQNENIKKGEILRKQLQQIEYGKPNNACREIYTMAEGMHQNLAVTHHLTDEYVTGPFGPQGQTISVKTGKLVLDGLSDTLRFVDVALRNEVQRTPSGPVIEGTFVKCGYNLGLEGLPVANPTWDNITKLISESMGGRMQFDHRQL